MADLGFGESGFDANAPENQRTNSVVPAGEYPAIMTESEKVATKAGDGHYLNCKFQIVRGEFQNRIVFQRFNLWLPASKEQALAIARGQFSEFCRAVNVPNPRDSSELHNKVCMIKVKVKQSEGYGDQNEIVKFSPLSGGGAAPIAGGEVPPSGTPATSGNPW